MNLPYFVAPLTGAYPHSQAQLGINLHGWRQSTFFFFFLNQDNLL